MNISLLDQQKLFGLFELDLSGTVLYSQPESDVEAGAAVAPDAAGRNFFHEVAPFENTEEFRRHICNFIDSNGQADNFLFTCRCDDGPQPVKVILARVRERSNGTRTKSILMYIRKVQPDAC